MSLITWEVLGHQRPEAMLLPIRWSKFTVYYEEEKKGVSTNDPGSEELAPDNQNVPINVDTKTDQRLPQQSSSASSRSAFETSVEQHTQQKVDVENQESCMRALIDPDEEYAYRLWIQSLEAMKNHHAPDADVEKALSGQHQPTTNAPGNTHVDSLLQQIKHPVDHHLRLIHIKGQVPAISVDPNGSRFILKKLDTATTGEIVMLYNEITPLMKSLIINVFANSVILKLLDYGPSVYTRKLIGNLKGYVLDLSLQLYGCRVIQKAFEITDTDQKVEMAKELGSNILKCVCDQHANHAIQKCIEFVPPQHIQFVYRSLRGKVKMLSSHPFGCHVIQKALEFCRDPQMKQALVTEILESVNELSVDPYGNYVVQYIVEHGEPREREIIVLKFDGRVMQMSHEKHSSNVIEKCLIHGSYMDRKRIIVEIFCAAGGTTADHLLGMIVHEYANYVIQRMLEVSREWQVDVIVKLVRRHEAMLAKYPHGRHVIAQVERVVNARAGLPGSVAPAPPQFP
ncbi:pumilio homolog 5-like [Lolium rigidum]|uniref:pumilio homolog 5-like n=1 Tax=Lolium rigidum TaxID=89674 RepID=UPI001F5C8CC8|nr:pumilio homolog 5-like [Lolium rigidum]